MTIKSPKEVIKKPILTIDAHYRVFIALGIAVAAFFGTFHFVMISTAILLAWMAFSLSVTTMDWIIIFTADARTFRETYKLEDSNRSMIFVLVVIASVASMFAIIFLMLGAKNGSKADVTGHVLLVIASVIASWLMVHTIFALRYGHMYYDTDDDDKDNKPLGGLEFPGDDKSPDYLDFAYFSFVIGMTFQVSDVEISDKQIRRLVLVHGLISFAFNTAIVALSINVISGLIGK